VKHGSRVRSRHRYHDATITMWILVARLVARCPSDFIRLLINRNYGIQSTNILIALRVGLASGQTRDRDGNVRFRMHRQNSSVGIFDSFSQLRKKFKDEAFIGHAKSIVSPINHRSRIEYGYSVVMHVPPLTRQPRPACQWQSRKRDSRRPY